MLNHDLIRSDRLWDHAITVGDVLSWTAWSILAVIVLSVGMMALGAAWTWFSKVDEL